MKKNKGILMILMSFMFVASILSISAALSSTTPTEVTFNGVWANGTTLYSNSFAIGNYIFNSKDTYPIRVPSACTTTTVCSVYNYHYESNCMRYNSYNKCIMTLKTRVNDNCKIYKTVTKCVSPKIGCENPVTGVYTNQLSLKAYQYSLDGVNWNVVPYNKLVVSNSTVIFRLNIPAVCSPEYYMNKAITEIFGSTQ
jgi:hypothetical protein